MAIIIVPWPVLIIMGVIAVVLLAIAAWGLSGE